MNIRQALIERKTPVVIEAHEVCRALNVTDRQLKLMTTKGTLENVTQGGTGRPMYLASQVRAYLVSSSRKIKQLHARKIQQGGKVGVECKSAI